MSKKGVPIDLQIKCPKCKAYYPDISHNGSYKRDEGNIPKFFCKVCDKNFSASTIKIKIEKPSREVEIGYKIKIAVQVYSLIGQGIKEVKYELNNNNILVESGVLMISENNIYQGRFDSAGAVPGTYQLKIIARDLSGYLSIQPRTILIKEHYDGLIWKIAPQFNLDPFLLKGLIWKESSFNPKVVSNRKAMGLTQLVPKTATEMGVTLPFEPGQNILGGAKYLSKLIALYDGNIRNALGAYNWGLGNVASVNKNEEKFPKGVKEYINRVLELKKKSEDQYQNYYEKK